MRILVLEDDKVQQGRIEQTLLDIGRSRNLRLEIDIAKNYGDVEKYSQYFDNYQLYLLDLEIGRYINQTPFLFLLPIYSKKKSKK